MRVLSSPEKFEKFSSRKHVDAALRAALETYIATGGVVKVEEKPFTVIYPTKQRLHFQIDEADKKRRYLETQMSHWQRTLSEAEGGSFLDGAKRLTDPLYLRHVFKKRTDKSYRQAVDVVDPPVEMMRDERYRRMMKMFLDSPEYRDRLIEARTSELGKRRRSIKETAQSKCDFKKDTANARLSKLSAEHDYCSRKIEAMRTLSNFAPVA